ncbi:MAG: hypothetical protein KBD37_01085 [Burkholderiales bacterium]|nr:hypothetical protein [Burkholderiales bacterium]
MLEINNTVNQNSDEYILDQIDIQNDLISDINPSTINTEIVEDSVTQAALEENDNHRKKVHKLKRDHKKQQIKNETQNIKLRKKYSEQNFGLVKIYLAVVALVLLITGCFNIVSNMPSIKVDFKIFSYEFIFNSNLNGKSYHQFLSDSVIITILTTTSINIIGIHLIALRYLFNKSKPKNKRKKD